MNKTVYGVSMKSSKTISLLLVLVLCVSVLVGCGKKTAVTTHDFEAKMTEKDYNVNVSAPINSPCITSVARKNNYDIMFYEFVADEQETGENDAAVEYAEKIFESITNELDQREKVKLMLVQVNLPGYSYYSFSASEQYYAVSRVGNTVMFASVPSEYKNEVADVFEELGYN